MFRIFFTLCIGKTMTCDSGFRIPGFRVARHWHNMRLPSFQTRPTMRRIWSEMFLKPENNTVWKLWQLSIIYLSRFIRILTTVKTTGKSRGKSATIQRNEYYGFFCHVISRVFVRWRSVSDGNPKTVTRRPEEMPSVTQNPIRKAQHL